MRIKKSVVFISTVIFLLALAGCGKGEKAPEASAPSKQPLLIDEFNASGELLSMAQIRWYDKESYQPYWNCSTPHSMTKGADGYYFAGYAKSGKESLFLGHVSADGTECVPVCSDASCDHESDDCTAVFSGYEPAVWYYRDYFYALKRDKGDVILVRVNPDGTGREELFEIGPVSVENRATYALTFYDDCIYTNIWAPTMNIRKEYGSYIRKRSLDGKTDEILIETKEARGAFGNVRCYGGNLFFTYYIEFHDEKKNGIVRESKGLYCYDCHTGKLNRVLDSNVSDYAVDMETGKLYCFVMYEGLYEYELATGEKKLIYEAEQETQICSMSYDGKYFCLDNRDWVQYAHFSDLFESSNDFRSITILTKNGSRVNEIKNPYSNSVLFGDDNMLFLFSGSVFAHEIGMKEEGKYVFFGPGYIKKSQIESAQDYKISVWP